MTSIKRKDMRPGTVFGLSDMGARWWIGETDALIVIDSTTELGFWTGITYHFGDVAPSMRFEVLAG